MNPNISSFASGFAAPLSTSLKESRKEYAARLNCSRAVPLRANGSIARSCGAESAAIVLNWRKRRREREGTARNGVLGYQSRFWESSNRQIRWRCAGARISDLKVSAELVLGAWQPHG